jgi:hypothetical protein
MSLADDAARFRSLACIIQKNLNSKLNDSWLVRGSNDYWKRNSRSFARHVSIIFYDMKNQESYHQWKAKLTNAAPAENIN